MRVRLLSIGFCAATLLCAGTAGAQTWNLSWSDEFNGSGAVSGSNWTYDVGGGGWGNAELEYYQSGNANANQANGVLTIQARQQSVGGMAYTSARLKTQGIRSFGPGDSTPVKIEGRMAGPSGQGFWPAFWMLGTNIGTVGWPGCGEIDIMEHINNATTAPMTIHWDSGGAASYTFGTANVGSSFGAYHTYAITWDANLITGFYDGANIGAANIQNNINSTEEFHKSFFIIMNLAVGGSWPGSPDGSTVFPANFNIDYVRYYTQGANATPTATATRTPTATSGSTATATATRTPTATSGGGGGCAAAWVSTTAYTGGSVVSRTCGSTTSNYTAAYWTQGNDPCTSSGPAGSGQPWGPPTACGGTTSTATATRTSTATATRTATATATTGGGTATATATRTATATATRTATATATSSSKCAGIAAFQSCTAYANGAKVVFNNTLYHSIAAIPSTRDCPPNSPYDPSTDNWWANDGGC